MHSSISSSDSTSEFENQYQTLDSGNERKVRFKTFLGGLFMSIAVVGLYKLLASNVPINDRVLGMMDYMPTLIAERSETKQVMVFGTSMVQAGFEPSQFDAYFDERNLDITSYNYGVGNLNPEFQQYVVRHIRRELEAADSKLELALLEFNPFQTTKARDVIGAYTRDQNEAILLSVDDLWDITLDDPDRGMRLFNIRFLREGLSAELITSAILLDSGDSPPQSSPERTEALAARRGKQEELLATFEEGYSPFSNAWDPALRGGRVKKNELSEESMDALYAYAESFNHPALMEPDLQRRIRQGDILGLDFEERLVQAFINMVNDLNAVSEQMEVVLLPRNTDWVTYTPEVQEKLNNLMARVTRETGVPVRDMQDHPDVTPEMFVDTTHLSFASGIDTYTRVLAETYESFLR